MSKMNLLRVQMLNNNITRFDFFKTILLKYQMKVFKYVYTTIQQFLENILNNFPKVSLK